jgi:hypothetical protein
MSNQKQTARLAGLYYLIMAIIGGFAYFSIQGIIVSGDAQSTVTNIVNSLTTYRASIFGSIISQVFFILLVLKLYELLKSINSFQALSMVALVLVSIPIGLVNLLFQFVPLIIINDVDLLEPFSLPEQSSISMLSLVILKYGLYVAQIFWGLWLLPLGCLVYKSIFIPKSLGIVLFLGGVVYVIGSLIFFILPDGLQTFEYFYSIPTIAEFSFSFWLMIKGVKEIKTTSI